MHEENRWFGGTVLRIYCEEDDSSLVKSIVRFVTTEHAYHIKNEKDVPAKDYGFQIGSFSVGIHHGGSNPRIPGPCVAAFKIIEQILKYEVLGEDTSLFHRAVKEWIHLSETRNRFKTVREICEDLYPGEEVPPGVARRVQYLYQDTYGEKPRRDRSMSVYDPEEHAPIVKKAWEMHHKYGRYGRTTMV